MTKIDPANDRLEIRPQSATNGALVAAGCAGFTLAGFWMMATGEGMDFLAGLVGVLLFGVGGFIAVPRMWRREVSAVLTPQGLEQKTIYGSATIFWDEIERVGVVKQFGTKTVGIRLVNYDRYLANMSPELAGAMTKSLPYLRWLARLTSWLDVPVALTLWSRLEGKRDLSQALKEFGKVGDLAAILLWQRKTFEHDVLIPWSDRDRPAEAFVTLLDRYRRQSLEARAA